ncbi:MAG: primosomal protein N' [Candidatus Hydrogenedentes bacterium]|nr:primosomal protein N' [Candidatus Hydrogenedentota bacterium]
MPPAIPTQPSQTDLFAEVVLPIPLDRTFCYAVPPSLRDRVAPGMRAVVPVLNRIDTGFIVAISPTPAVEKVKSIIDLPDETPVFSREMLALCRWIADYYCCSWGEALQCAVPRGLKIGTRMRYRLVPEMLDAGRFTDRQRAVIAALYKRGPLTEGQLAGDAGRQALSNTLNALIRRGVVVAEPVLQDAGVSIRTEWYAELNTAALLDNDALAQLQRRAPKQAAIYLDLLHTGGALAVSALSEKHQTTLATARSLAQKGLVRLAERELFRRPDTGAPGHAAEKFPLNEEQQAAYEAIAASLEARTFQTYLLRGITGSGKTEVYLQAIERTLELGRDAIVLVPEISLTPQTVGRFVARFKQDIAVLHSGLSLGERYDEWRRAQRGEVRIVVGARSAVFAPLPNLGMIIVDEEHDSSYKQGESPRYHARDVAIMRAHNNHAVCVLGSATPAIESYHNAEIGKSIRLDLTKRATNAALPSVKVLDMRIEAKENAGQVMLSRTLEDAVNARVDAREQVILLLNRRGFAPFVLCPQCGWVAECADCNVSMTYHSAGALLRCHYCNATRPKPEICDKCYFNPLIYLGAGTQKVEDYLMHAFPKARVARMDADTTSGKGGHAKILGRFASGEIDILIGTQMLAKGHDFPGVTLVGVINADTGLCMPDFRAAEQAFQLLTQVAGRAGRGDQPGEVIIQSFRPNHYAVRAAADHDYHAFFAQEIAHREGAQYPPFRRLVNFAVESEDQELAERGMFALGRIVRELIRSGGFQGMEVMGPAPAAVKKVKKHYRWHLGVLSRSAKKLNALTRHSRDQFLEQHKGRKVLLKVDLDPYGIF